MEQENTTEQIAKNDTRQKNSVENSDDTISTDTIDDAPPEMPENMNGQMMNGGPMGEGFQNSVTTSAPTDTNEWLVPMTATGIISGAIILSAIAVCLTIVFTNKKR